MNSGNYYSRLSDCHLHTHFSSDSDNPPENVIKQAIALGLKSICFTDHNDFDYPLEDGKVVFDLDLKSYIDTITRLKEKYSHNITINVGVEQGLMPSVADRVNAYDKDCHLDFIIGSSHLVYGNDPYYDDFWKNVSVKDSIISYYQCVIDSIKTCDNFDVYGHLDYIIRYAPGKDTDYNWMDYYDYIDTALRMLIEKGKGIEINTASLKYGLKYPNPCPDILKGIVSLAVRLLQLVLMRTRLNMLRTGLMLLRICLKVLGLDIIRCLRGESRCLLSCKNI